MSLLALRSSHRGVRLHTFEPEDRAYTSTPTKIGGHCLDHIRNGLTVTWRRSLNSKSTTTTDIRSTTTATTGSRHVPRDDSRSSNTDRGKRLTGLAGEVPAAYSTTLDPSMGRFGGLGAVVLKLRSQRRADLTPRTAALLASPLYPILDDRPPDTLATPGEAFPTIDAVPWQQQEDQRQQQQEEQLHRRAYGPEWPAVTVEGEVTDPTVAPHGLGSGRTSSMPAAQRRSGPGASPYRSITTAATGHSGALMAILLSKLTNSGRSEGRREDGGDLNNATGGGAVHPGANPSARVAHSSSGKSDDGVSFDASQGERETAALPPMEALRHSVDGVVRGLDDVAAGSTNASAVLAGGLGGGSWAWKARVEQTPRYSKLRRYDFVRELGSGSHGTVLLVRKRCPGGGGGGGGGRCGISSARTVGGSYLALASGSGSRKNSGHFAGISSSSGSSSSGQAGGLRVLKESQFLPEAVNEARLLLLAGGGGGRGSASGGDKAEAGAAATGGSTRRASLADVPGSKRRVAGAGAVKTGADVGVGGSRGVTSTGRDDGDRRGEERGEVVQLHDFFVETVGHRSLAFLELEYCEGGDLRDLILAGRAAPSPAAAGAPHWKGDGGDGGSGGVGVARAPAESAESKTRRGASGRGAETRATEGRYIVGDEATYAPAQQQSEETGAGVTSGGGGGGGDGGRSFGSAHGGLDAGQRLLEGDGGSSWSWGDADAGEGAVGLPAAQIGRVALGLCEGLQRLHERGVLHRDLKPANVLLTKTGAVRVADLGVSTSLDPSRPLTENAAGTIPFMAPEVRKYLLGSKISYSGKADVWAVGALVYAMAVGNPAPEELATLPRSQLVSAVGHQTRSEALSLVAHRALNPDPSRRPTVHQMRSMLQALCEREGWLSPRSPSGQHGMVVPMARL